MFRRRWVWWRVAVAAVGLLAVDRTVAYKVREITRPARSTSPPMVDDVGEPIRQVTFPASDGIQLGGWYIPSRNKSAILVQHGYRDCSHSMLWNGLMLARHGFGVLWFDFRGHGASGGDKVTLGLRETADTDGAVAFLTRQPDVDPDRIGLLGNSMGGAVGILAAADNPRIRAVVVEGAFAELVDEVGIGIEVQTPLPAEPFATVFIALAQWQTGYRLSEVSPVKAIGRIAPRAVFLLHDGRDQRIKRDSGDRLYAAAGAPKELWTHPGARHTEIAHLVPVAYECRVVEFFRRYLLSLK